MKRYIEPEKSLWNALTERVVADDAVIEERVLSILSRVRAEGDGALVALSAEIDRVDLSGGIEVSAEEIAKASDEVSQELKEAISAAYENIYKFHTAQKAVPVDMQTVQGVRSGSDFAKFQRIEGKQRRSSKNRREIVNLKGARVRRR